MIQLRPNPEAWIWVITPRKRFEKCGLRFGNKGPVPNVSHNPHHDSTSAIGDRGSGFPHPEVFPDSTLPWPAKLGEAFIDQDGVLRRRIVRPVKPPPCH